MSPITRIRTAGHRSVRVAALGTLFGLLALVMAVVPVSASPPAISATPNPVSIAWGTDLGDVTINWTSGNSVVPEYWVSTDGGTETFYSIIHTASGSVYVHNGVQFGHTYSARLYTPGHGSLLASVVITTTRPPLKDQFREPLAYNPDPGCPACGVMLNPGAVVTNPVINNPVITNPAIKAGGGA